MARMSVDDSVARDPRITELADKLGWSRRETVGCLVSEVWPICYDQATHLVSPRLIDIAAKHVGFAQAMVDCELASRDRSGKIQIRGAQKRVKYIKDKEDAGREGGLKSAEVRRSIPKQAEKQTGKQPEAAGNPNTNTPVPDSAPVPDPVNTPSYKNPLPPSGAPSVGSRKAKPSDLTEPEQQAVRSVLVKLGAQNGIAYTGSPEHQRLIAGRLREGVSEHDLRKIIAYCATELHWVDKPEMQQYLRPETLFGPKTIAKYLDPARAWFSKLPGAREHEQLASASGGGA